MGKVTWCLEKSSITSMTVDSRETRQTVTAVAVDEVCAATMQAWLRPTFIYIWFGNLSILKLWITSIVKLNVMGILLVIFFFICLRYLRFFNLFHTQNQWSLQHMYSWSHTQWMYTAHRFHRRSFHTDLRYIKNMQKCLISLQGTLIGIKTTIIPGANKSQLSATIFFLKFHQPGFLHVGVNIQRRGFEGHWGL